MASIDPDITWLTYDEAARALGIKADSVRRRAAARRWPRRLGNDNLARVGIPTDLIRGSSRDSAPDAPPAITPVDTPDLRDGTVEALRWERDQARLEAATLRVELAKAHERLMETAVHLNQRLADAQAEREREVAQLREDRDRWHTLAVTPEPTWLSRIWASISRPSMT